MNKNPIENNGIKANIVFSIDENENSRFVIISPFNFDPNLETLEASKIWLEGITEGEKYKTTESSIIVDYNWGYLIAQYYPDRDYGSWILYQRLLRCMKTESSLSPMM